MAIFLNQKKLSDIFLVAERENIKGFRKRIAAFDLNLKPYCAGGGTGRHVRLRGVSRKV
jgi:hypothetical protein